MGCIFHQKNCSCLLADCESLLSPANGSLSTKDVIAGTIVSVSCEAGFTLFGNETLLCQDGGAWNGSQGTCKKGTCS